MENTPSENKQERYAGERFTLVERVPFALQRILIIGAGRGELGYLLRKRPRTKVYGTEVSAQALPTARVTLHSIHAGRFGSSELSPPLPPIPFDAILLIDPFQLSVSGAAGLESVAARLAPHGWVFVVVPGDRDEQQFANEIAQAGLKAYLSFDLEAGWPGDETLRVLVRREYDLFAHARSVIERGRPNNAFQLLDMAPEELAFHVQTRPKLIREKFRCLRHWGKGNPPERLAFLYKAFELFGETMRYAPDEYEVFESLAEYWRAEGVPERADRLMRIHAQYVGDPALLAKMPPLPSLEVSSTPLHHLPPLWRPRGRLPRLLFLIHPNPHYGVDVLYDGLCSLLGDENVVDFPYKPTLHGEIVEKYRHYPCNNTRPGVRFSLAEIQAQLRSREFDLILFGDCELEIDSELLGEVISVAGETPIAIVDQTDTFDDIRLLLAKALSLPPDTCYFKREMLCAVDYGINAFPLPFSYMDDRVPAEASFDRDIPIFWAGFRADGTRRHYLEHLERALNRSFDAFYTPGEYAQSLARARIGLNLAGAGFDTVRYWELPAHGAMLLSEAFPIVIPEDFQDGVEAVFFRDLHEMEERALYYMAHPEQAAEIARAGRARFLEHHTSSARARQCLGWLRSMYPRHI